ncbi:MAG: outer membrane beta-barrel protein [Pseudomonadota bacterium]
MTKSLLAGAAIAAAALLGTTAAHADDAGWYASLGGGVNWVDEISGNGASIDFDAGYTIVGAVGYAYADSETGRFRAEGEISWTSNELDTISAGGVSATVGGELDQFGFMVQGLYDFLPDSGIRPYLGVGIGVVDGDVSATLGGVTVKSDGTNFAYRGLAGVGIALGDSATLDVGYRFTGVTSDENINNNAAVAQVRFNF